jgi:hypothetical protein
MAVFRVSKDILPHFGRSRARVLHDQTSGLC